MRKNIGRRIMEISQECRKWLSVVICVWGGLDAIGNIITMAELGSIELMIPCFIKVAIDIILVVAAGWLSELATVLVCGFGSIVDEFENGITVNVVYQEGNEMDEDLADR